MQMAEKKSYKELTIKKRHPLCEMITRIFTKYTYSDSVSISGSYDNKSKEKQLQHLFLMFGGEDWHPFIWFSQRRPVFGYFVHYNCHYLFYVYSGNDSRGVFFKLRRWGNGYFSYDGLVELF